jgi:hypothetical protein
MSAGLSGGDALFYRRPLDRLGMLQIHEGADEEEKLTLVEPVLALMKQLISAWRQRYTPRARITSHTASPSMSCSLFRRLSLH